MPNPSRSRTLAPAVATALLWSSVAAAQGFHPNHRFDVHTGTAPGAIVVADFDGDGRPDVATANVGGNSVSILLARGRGFAPRTDVPLTFGPTSLIAADVNGDGDLDLVAASWPSSALTLLANDGAGHFAAGAPITVATEPTGVAAGDWNDDGKLDLAIAHAGAAAIGLLFGNGSGGFGGEVLRPLGAQPQVIRSADLDRDGHDDLVFTIPGSAAVGVLRGAGTGAFTDGGTPAVGTAPSDLAIGDFDGDGLPDLVTSNFIAGSLSLLHGLGGGAFALHEDLAGGGYSVTAADVTGDGRLDLLVGSTTTANLSLFVNDGSGAFASPVSIPTGQSPMAAGAGDLDGDGNLDIVTANRGANDITATYGYRLAEFQPRRDFTTGVAPFAMALGDVDGDGHLDVATANWGNNSLSVLRGDGAGNLGSRSNVRIDLPLSVRIGDVDGDGHADLVGTSSLAGQVDVFPGDGAGHFATAIPSDGGTSPQSLALADLDGDSHLDLVYACTDHVQSSLGAGDGTFTAANSYPTGSLAHVALAHLDGDPHLDAIAVVRSTGAMQILHGRGDGSFGPIQNVGFYPGAPTGVTVADFNGDGRPDIAVSIQGFYGPPPVAPGLDLFLVNGGFEGIDSADLNGDGIPDVACASPNEEGVAVFHGGSSAPLSDEVDLSTAGRAYAVACGDLNEDGAADVAAAVFASGTDNRVGVFLGKLGTRTTLAVSPATLLPGQALTLDADVTTPIGVANSGAVTFFDRGTPLATVPVSGGGHAHAVLSAPVLPTGSIVAVYTGTAVRSSQSDPATVRVVRPAVTAVSPPGAAAGTLRILGPNPIDGRHLALTLAGGAAAPAEIEVFDSSGRRVAGIATAAGTGPRPIAIDLPAGNPPGLYFVRARQGGAEALRRVTILF